MTMPASDFNEPRGSFPTPVKPIGVGPLSAPLVSVSFNLAWCQVIVGSLSQLLLNTTWDVDTQTALTAIQEDVFDLMSAFCVNPPPAGLPIIAQVGADEDFMLRQNPDNPCELQTSVDGQTWCTWADLSKCLANTQQPGSGTPQPAPGGGCQEYDMYLEANGKWLVPTFFNNGDTIELTEITGAGSDGTVNHWYCPNGQAFVLGACVGLTGTSSGDPDPTQPHMSLVLNVGGLIFPLTTGPITLTGLTGVADSFIQVNDSILSDNSGSYRAKVRVCNNQAASWTKTFDFTASPAGWTARPPTPQAFAHWQAGSGWLPDLGDQGSGNNHYRIYIELTGVSAFDLDSMQVAFNFNPSSSPLDPAEIGYQFAATDGGTHNEVLKYGSGYMTGDNLVEFGGIAFTGITGLFAFVDIFNCAGTSCGPSGSGLIKSVTIAGHGTEPTWP